MNNQNGPQLLMSRTMFISQVAAISVYGLAIAIISFLAGESLEAALILFAIVAMILVVFVFRLPAYFADKVSLGGLIFIALLFSVFALAIALSDASTYVGLPEFLSSRPGTSNLTTSAFIGVISFTLALLANILAAVMALRRKSHVPQ